VSTRVRLLVVLLVGGVVGMGCVGGRGESDGAGAGLGGGDSDGGESVDAGDAGAGRDAGPPRLSRATMPECFALADALAANLEAHSACAEDADCRGASLPGLECFLPQLQSERRPICAGWFAVAVGSPIYDDQRMGELRECASDALGGQPIEHAVRADGTPCPFRCGVVPVPRCSDGTCAWAPL